MKKIFIIMLIAFASCKKEANNETDNLFTETKNNVQINEPVLLSFGDNTTNSNVAWTVQPNTSYTMEQVNAYATFNFNTAGSYLVKATSNNKQGTYIINVNNNLFNEYGTDFSLASDKLTGIKINEPVSFNAHNASNAIAQSDWSVLYNFTFTDLGFLNNNSTYTLSFKDAGAKHISLSNGSKKIYRTVWVNDGAAADSYLKSFIYSDRLTLTPKAIFKNGVMTQIDFTATTTYNYMCSTDEIISDAFVYTNASQNKDYILSYGGVKMAATSCSNNAKPATTNSFTDLMVGNNKFYINYLNKTFEGTITIENNKGIITFDDNSLIHFTTKTF